MRSWFGIVAVSVVGGALAAACSAGGEGLPQQNAGRGGAPPVVPVTTASVVEKSMPVDIRVIGTAEAYSTVQVRAQITGELTSANFKEGDEIKKGQVLFTLDRRPLEAALQQAEANLQRDLAQAANARSQATRYQDLQKRGIATREQVDQITTNSAALEATVNADRAAVENAKVQLQYATINAPISGRTGTLMVHAGNLVRANDAAPLVIINQISPIYVSFGVPEAQLPALKRYLAQGTVKVEATPPNEAGAGARGQISFVDNAVDQTTGTIKVKGTFPNEDRRLWPGLFVNVVITLTTINDAIVVPSAAVQMGQQGQYVYVVKPDQTAELRPVSVTRASSTETVIEKGLKPGETVVTDGQLRLTPGSRVSIKGGADGKVTP